MVAKATASVGKLGPQPPRVDPPPAPLTRRVRALRDHYGPRGMVMAGEESDRSAEDAAYLLAQGVVSIVGDTKT